MKTTHSKACLYLYPHIDETLQRLHDIRIHKALASMNNPNFAEQQCIEIAQLQIESEDLRELKRKIDKVLSTFSQEDIDLFEYKYFKRKPKGYFKDFDYKSRNYFRRQIKAINRFDKRLKALGVNELWLNENLKFHLKGYVRLVQETEEAMTRKYKKKGD